MFQVVFDSMGKAEASRGVNVAITSQYVYPFSEGKGHVLQHTDFHIMNT